MAAARSRFENLDDDEREEILRSAGEEFAEQGYSGTSLSDIIERTGISKGSLYYYFENKQDIFVTVIEHALDHIVQKVAGGFSLDDLTSENFWSYLEKVSRRMFRHFLEHRWYIQLGRTLYRLRDRHGEEGPTEVVFERARTWTDRILRRGQQLGVIRDDMPRELLVEISLAVAEAEDRWLIEHFEDLSDEELEREIGRMIHIFRRVLEPE